jgi:hypothetical protein
MGKKKNKKDKKKKVDTKKYPTNVDARAKEAAMLEPPELNEDKMENENRIEKFLRFRPKVKKKKGETIKEIARFKN